MSDQLEMEFKKPVITPTEVDQFVELLFAHGGWITANELLDQLAMQRTETNRRKLRAWANASDGRIASGQQGYKHIGHMTAQEYNHFRNAMKSQSDEMLARILRCDRYFYSRQSVQPGNGILEVSSKPTL